MTEAITRKPKILGWEITNSCNLKCPHCYNPPSRHKEAELTTSECIQVIDSAAKLGTERIGWTGGEPLLREDLEDLITYAGDNHGITSGITTNGVLLNKERAIRLNDAGVQSMQISLDGTTAERSWRIRRTTDEEFESVIEAVRISLELGIKTYLAMLLGAENLDDGREMLKLARHEGVDGIRFCGFTPEGRGQSGAIQRRFHFGDRLHELHEFIEETSADDSLLTIFDPGFGPVPPDYWFHECIAGIETCYIKANGDVFPCTAMLYDQFKIGNLTTHSLADLWNDPAMTAMACFPRSEIDGDCAICDNFKQCHGACRCLTYAHTGSFHESFPVCLYQAGISEREIQKQSK
jgi:radical SAM protein with 4Fe4S-binding SPASM domain